MQAKNIFLILLLLAIMPAFRTVPAHTMRGRVFDEQNKPVSGAMVHEKNILKGTATDSAGRFVLEVSGTQAQLTVSSIGYQVAEVTAREGKKVEVYLKKSSTELDEIVVTGYTVQREQSLMGRASGVVVRGLKSNRVNQVPAQSYADAAPVTGHGTRRRTKPEESREGYDLIQENGFLKVGDNPLSTFSIDVDAASYSNVRRMLNAGMLPPAGAVRIEELINYFRYEYPQPSGTDPFSVNTEMASCPWNPLHRLVGIGLQGKQLAVDKLPPSNLTFLIDVSGSMDEEDKLPLVISSLKLLTEQLREQDKMSIVVYAGNAGLVLPPTSGTAKSTIMQALDRLQAGGSTAGGEGIRLAYRTARENLLPAGNNRVILCTDGDFNVGMSSDDELERLIEKERESGIFLTVLGYGTGNYQDAKMQKLADKGNGNHAYIDNLLEARKVLVREFGATLFTIAKDVKLQIEFNPEKVQGYRLIGYENRLLAKEDFNNDRKDAGDMGSGHTVTALYEIIPTGVKSPELDSVDALRYRKPEGLKDKVAFSGELMNIRLRYKQPDSHKSSLLERVVTDRQADISSASANLRFAAAVSEFGMLLRNSAFKGSSSFGAAEDLARKAGSYDPEGYRREFLGLLQKAQQLNKDVAVKPVY